MHPLSTYEAHRRDQVALLRRSTQHRTDAPVAARRARSHRRPPDPPDRRSDARVPDAWLTTASPVAP